MTKVYVYHLFEGTIEVASFESYKWLSDYEIKKRKWRYEKNAKQSLRWVVEERKLTFDEVLDMREDSPGEEPIEYTDEQKAQMWHEEQQRQQRD